MKTKDFLNILKERGYVRTRKGKHEIWSNAAGHHVAVPSGNEINKMLAKRVLKEIGVG